MSEKQWLVVPDGSIARRTYVNAPTWYLSRELSGARDVMATKSVEIELIVDPRNPARCKHMKFIADLCFPCVALRHKGRHVFWKDGELVTSE